jgi:hypothetical protein
MGEVRELQTAQAWLEVSIARSRARASRAPANSPPRSSRIRIGGRAGCAQTMPAFPPHLFMAELVAI